MVEIKIRDKKNFSLDINFSYSKASRSYIAGFTLIEMLVALAIFASIVTIISTIFVSSLRAQRQSLVSQQLLAQTSYLIEYISRTLRMAMKDDISIWGFPPKSCLNGEKINYEFDGQCLKFRNYKDQCQEFCLEEGRLKEIKDGIENYLTSPGLIVAPLAESPAWINLSGQGQEDNLQPLVTILLEIKGREQAKVQIKTSISQRNLDVQR